MEYAEYSAATNFDLMADCSLLKRGRLFEYFDTTEVNSFNADHFNADRLNSFQHNNI